MNEECGVEIGDLNFGAKSGMLRTEVSQLALTLALILVFLRKNPLVRSFRSTDSVRSTEVCTEH